MASPTKVLVLSVCFNCFALPKSTSTICPSPESMQFSVFRSLGREEEGRGRGGEGRGGEGRGGEGRGRREEGRGVGIRRKWATRKEKRRQGTEVETI